MYHRPLFRRRPRRAYSAAAQGGAGTGRYSMRAALFIGAAILLLILISSSIYLKGISSQIASADAKDVMTAKINAAIVETLSEGDYDGDYFVTFQKAENGDVSAISSNMARINDLSAKILDKLVGSTKDNTITIGIPAGSLTGASLLMGRGPKIPVRIIVLSSSSVEFSNSIVTAGINQTKHQINLCVTVNMQILVPWGTEDTEVSTDVLIADTVIVGKVPETYLNMQ